MVLPFILIHEKSLILSVIYILYMKPSSFNVYILSRHNSFFLMLSCGVHLAHAQSCCYIFYIVIRDKIF